MTLREQAIEAMARSAHDARYGVPGLYNTASEKEREMARVVATAALDALLAALDAMLTGNEPTRRAALDMIARYNAAAEAALAPKLTWTEWDSGPFERSLLLLGTLSVGKIYQNKAVVCGMLWSGPMLEAPNTPEAIISLRAELERRVREAMS
jgi:hypothetical protein